MNKNIINSLLELNNLIEENTLDYIAIATTHWHAIGIDAELKDKYYDDRIGVVLIIPHTKDGLLISPNDFISAGKKGCEIYTVNKVKSNLSLKDNLKIMRGLFNILLTNKNNKKRLKIICPLKPYLPLMSIFSNKKTFVNFFPVFILIDEGIGTYASKNAWRKVVNIDNNIKGLSLKGIMKNNIALPILNNLVSKIGTEKRFLYKLNDVGSLQINSNIAIRYKDILPKIDILSESNVAVLITQPFSEYEFISREDEIATTHFLVNALLEKYEKVYIKPHPRENLEKYKEFDEMKHVEVIYKNVPIEKELLYLGPSIIVGYTSTALITSKTIYDIESYSAISYLIPKASDINSAKIWEEYYNLSKEIVKDFRSFIESPGTQESNMTGKNRVNLFEKDF